MKELVDYSQQDLPKKNVSADCPLIYKTFDDLRAQTPEWFTILCSQFGSLMVSQWLESKNK